jgi:hypothetical protein
VALGFSVALVSPAGAQEETPQWVGQTTIPGYSHPSSYFGQTAVGLGDIDGDGAPDILISEPETARPPWDFYGRLLLYKGACGTGISSPEAWTYAEPFPGVIGHQLAWEPQGNGMGWVGDVNGDTFADAVSVHHPGDYGELVDITCDPPPAPQAWAASQSCLRSGGACESYCNFPWLDPGRLRAWHGSPTGLVPAPAFVIGHPDCSMSPSDWKTSAGGVGDINGDGFDDLATTSRVWHDDFDTAGCGVDCNEWPPVLDVVGSLFIHLGSPDGLPSQPSYEVIPPCGPPHLWLGELHAAGDVNGDGFADLLISTWGGRRLDIEEPTVGYVGVYHGGPAALDGAPDWSRFGTATHPNLGLSASSAGDVNGDGFSDIVVASLDQVELFLGSATGLATTPAWTGSYFAVELAPAGDVNGDTFGDVLLGSYDEAHVLAGTASGSLTPSWSHSGEEGGGFGHAVASAGDVNCDCLDDILVGEPNVALGRAYVFLGKRPTAVIPIPDVPDAAVESLDLTTVNPSHAIDVSRDSRSGPDPYLGPEWVNANLSLSPDPDVFDIDAEDFGDSRHPFACVRNATLVVSTLRVRVRDDAAYPDLGKVGIRGRLTLERDGIVRVYEFVNASAPSLNASVLTFSGLVASQPLPDAADRIKPLVIEWELNRDTTFECKYKAIGATDLPAHVTWAPPIAGDCGSTIYESQLDIATRALPGLAEHSRRDPSELIRAVYSTFESEVESGVARVSIDGDNVEDSDPGRSYWPSPTNPMLAVFSAERNQTFEWEHLLDPDPLPVGGYDLEGFGKCGSWAGLLDCCIKALGLPGTQLRGIMGTYAGPSPIAAPFWSGLEVKAWSGAVSATGCQATLAPVPAGFTAAGLTFAWALLADNPGTRGQKQANPHSSFTDHVVVYQSGSSWKAIFDPSYGAPVLVGPSDDAVLRQWQDRSVGAWSVLCDAPHPQQRRFKLNAVGDSRAVTFFEWGP